MSYMPVYTGLRIIALYRAVLSGIGLYSVAYACIEWYGVV